MCRNAWETFIFSGEMCNYVRKRECVQHIALRLLVHPRCFLSVSRCIRAAKPHGFVRAQGFAGAPAHPRRRCRGVFSYLSQRAGGRAGTGHVPSAQQVGRPRPLADARGCPRGREQPSRAVRARVGSAAPRPQPRFSRRGHSGAAPGRARGSLPSGLGEGKRKPRRSNSLQLLPSSHLASLPLCSLPLSPSLSPFISPFPSLPLSNSCH